MKILLSFLYLMFTTLGLLFMKKGESNLSLTFLPNFNFNIGYITLLGFLFYVVSFFLWQSLLVKFDLSYIFPILTGIVQVLVLLMGVFIFKEQINWYNIVGIILVILGIILISIRR